MMHPLTTEELKILIDAWGDGKNPPKMTANPRVNFAIDCLVEETGPDDEPEYNEDEQKEEIQAAKDAGLL